MTDARPMANMNTRTAAAAMLANFIGASCLSEVIFEEVSRGE